MILCGEKINKKIEKGIDKRAIIMYNKDTIEQGNKET
jgi:hypothetical protein